MVVVDKTSDELPGNHVLCVQYLPPTIWCIHKRRPDIRVLQENELLVHSLSDIYSEMFADILPYEGL